MKRTSSGSSLDGSHHHKHKTGVTPTTSGSTNQKSPSSSSSTSTSSSSGHHHGSGHSKLASSSNRTSTSGIDTGGSKTSSSSSSLVKSGSSKSLGTSFSTSLKPGSSVLTVGSKLTGSPTKSGSSMPPAKIVSSNSHTKSLAPKGGLSILSTATGSSNSLTKIGSLNSSSKIGSSTSSVKIGSVSSSTKVGSSNPPSKFVSSSSSTKGGIMSSTHKSTSSHSHTKSGHSQSIPHGKGGNSSASNGGKGGLTGLPSSGIKNTILDSSLKSGSSGSGAKGLFTDFSIKIRSSYSSTKNKSSDLSIKNRSLESTMKNKSSESLVKNKSPESLVKNKSPESLVKNKSPESLVKNKSSESLMKNKSSESLVKNKSSESSVKNKFSEHSMKNKSSEHSKKNKSSEHSVKNKSSEHSVKNKSSEHSMKNKSSEHSVKNKSTEHSMKKKSTEHSVKKKSTEHSTKKKSSDSSTKSKSSDSSVKHKSSASPVKSTTSDSPMKSRSSDFPMKSRSSDSPMKCRSSDSPVKSRSSVSPVKNKSSDSPTKTRSSDSPTKTRSSDSPMKSRSSDSSMKSRSSDSLMKSRSSDAPVKSKSSDSAIKNKFSNSSIKSKSSDSSIKSKSSESSTKSRSTDTPVKVRSSDSSIKNGSSTSNMKNTSLDSFVKCVTSNSNIKNKPIESSLKSLTSISATKSGISDSSVKTGSSTHVSKSGSVKHGLTDSSEKKAKTKPMKPFPLKGLDTSTFITSDFSKSSSSFSKSSPNLTSSLNVPKSVSLSSNVPSGTSSKLSSASSSLSTVSKVSSSAPKELPISFITSKPQKTSSTSTVLTSTLPSKSSSSAKSSKSSFTSNEVSSLSKSHKTSHKSTKTDIVKSTLPEIDKSIFSFLVPPSDSNQTSKVAYSKSSGSVNEVNKIGSSKSTIASVSPVKQALEVGPTLKTSKQTSKPKLKPKFSDNFNIKNDTKSTSTNSITPNIISKELLLKLPIINKPVSTLATSSVDKAKRKPQKKVVKARGVKLLRRKFRALKVKYTKYRMNRLKKLRIYARKCAVTHERAKKLLSTLSPLRLKLIRKDLESSHSKLVTKKDARNERLILESLLPSEPNNTTNSNTAATCPNFNENETDVTLSSTLSSASTVRKIRKRIRIVSLEPRQLKRLNPKKRLRIFDIRRKYNPTRILENVEKENLRRYKHVVASIADRIRRKYFNTLKQTSNQLKKQNKLSKNIACARVNQIIRRSIRKRKHISKNQSSTTSKIKLRNKNMVKENSLKCMNKSLTLQSRKNANLGTYPIDTKKISKHATKSPVKKTESSRQLERVKILKQRHDSANTTRKTPTLQLKPAIEDQKLLRAMMPPPKHRAPRAVKVNTSKEPFDFDKIASPNLKQPTHPQQSQHIPTTSFKAIIRTSPPPTKKRKICNVTSIPIKKKKVSISTKNGLGDRYSGHAKIFSQKVKYEDSNRNSTNASRLISTTSSKKLQPKGILKVPSSTTLRNKGQLKQTKVGPTKTKPSTVMPSNKLKLANEKLKASIKVKRAKLCMPYYIPHKRVTEAQLRGAISMKALKCGLKSTTKVPTDNSTNLNFKALKLEEYKWKSLFCSKHYHYLKSSNTTQDGSSLKQVQRKPTNPDLKDRNRNQIYLNPLSIKVKKILAPTKKLKRLPMHSSPLLKNILQLAHYKRSLEANISSVKAGNPIVSRPQYPKFKPTPIGNKLTERYIPLSPKDVNAILTRKGCLASARAGWTDIEQPALENVVGALKDFYTSITTRLKEVCEQEVAGFDHGFPDPAERVLTEMGFGGIQGINSYYQSDVVDCHQWMVAECKRKEDRLAELIEAKRKGSTATKVQKKSKEVATSVAPKVPDSHSVSSPPVVSLISPPVSPTSCQQQPSTSSMSSLGNRTLLEILSSMDSAQNNNLNNTSNNLSLQKGRDPLDLDKSNLLRLNFFEELPNNDENSTVILASGSSPLTL